MEKLDRYLQTALEEYCPEERIKQAIWDRLKKEIDWRDANPAGLFNYPAAGLQQIFHLVFSIRFILETRRGRAKRILWLFYNSSLYVQSSDSNWLSRS